jgi:hypothetical protein
METRFLMFDENLVGTLIPCRDLHIALLSSVVRV